VCAAAAVWPDEAGGRQVVVRGTVEGMVPEGPRGTGGFGYDPIMVPVEGDGRTFAEMTEAEKHALSHRGRAFRALAVHLVP
jgi:XTP/dITP diphosphohydrolase